MSKYLADNCTVDLGVDEFYNCIRCSYGDLKTYRKEINRKGSNESKRYDTNA